METLQTLQKNRRALRRKKPRTTAKIECRKGSYGLGPNIAAAFLDISESGIGLILKVPLEPDDEAEIVIRDYGIRAPIKHLARVCWCLPLQDGRFCVGLKFEKWIPYSDVQLMAKP
jgi:PilZ domain-containing protein